MLKAPQEGKGAQMRLNSRCAYNRIVWSRAIVKCETDCEAVSVWEPVTKSRCVPEFKVRLTTSDYGMSQDQCE